MSPNRSAKVSMLVRPPNMGLFDSCGPGVDCADRAAWSLCCQQYRASSDRSLARSLALIRALVAGDSSSTIERLHGRPLDVRPWHVDAGSLESDRPRRDSGVLAKTGILRSV